MLPMKAVLLVVLVAGVAAQIIRLITPFERLMERAGNAYPGISYDCRWCLVTCTIRLCRCRQYCIFPDSWVLSICARAMIPSLPNDTTQSHPDGLTCKVECSDANVFCMNMCYDSVCVRYGQRSDDFADSL